MTDTATADTAPQFAEDQNVDYRGYACAIVEIRGAVCDLRLRQHEHVDFWSIPLTALRPEPKS